MPQRDTRFPSTVIEVLRFCVVAFLAAVGYQVGRGFGSGERVVGLFDAPALGVLLGGASGYVIGGVVARLTSVSVTRTESALSGRSAEQLLAGMTGAVAGVLAAAALTWPVLLVGSLQLTTPLFLFVLVTIGSLGYRMGLARRQGVLSLLGGSGRLAVPRPAPSSLPMVVDTSAAIDGRVVDVVRSGFLHGSLLVPEPVLGELQAFADSGDEQRRAKGRRGLETLTSLRENHGVDVEVIADEAPDVAEVDTKLVHICQRRGASLLTLDTNLVRVAQVAGCPVLNLHGLALAMRPPVVAGDRIRVLLTRPGKDAGQAVGYLDDGTMVVVEHAREQVGSEADVVVLSVLITANGRMVFARLDGAAGGDGVPRPREADRQGAEVAAQIAAAAARARRR